MPKQGKRLTDRVVRQAPHRATYHEMPDAGSGLVLRVAAKPSLKKTWQLRWRFNGKQKRITLGSYPAMSLEEARAEAIRVKQDGPVEQAIPKTVADLVAAFRARHVRPNLSEKSVKEYERYLQEICDAWGRRPVGDVSRRDVASLIADKTEQARAKGGNGMAGVLLRRVLHKLFNWAVKQGLVEQNPVAGTEAPVKAVRRNNRLAIGEGDGGSDVEGTVRDYLAALEDTPMVEATRRAIKLCMALGLREQEAARIAREHVDLEQGVIYIQGKGAKERRLPLSPYATGIIEAQLAECTTDSNWLFPQRHDPTKPIGADGLSKAHARAARNAGMLDLHLHDLRRTAATGLRELGAARDTVGRILGHAVHDVTGVYVRSTLHDEMQAAMEQWSDFLLERTSKE